MRAVAGSILAALTLLSAPMHSAGAQQVDAALQKAARLYDTVRTARGTIEQTVRNTVMRSSQTTKADYQQQFPNLLSLRFTDPRGDLLVSDGAAVWFYQPSVDRTRVMKTSLSAVSAWVNLMSNLKTGMRSRFNVTDGGAETIGGVATRAAILVPKEEMPGMLRLKVWIDDKSGEVRQFEVQENPDLVRTIRFATLQLNAAVEAARFKYTPPSGVRVETVGGT